MKIGYIMQQGVEIRRPPFNGPANHVRHIVEEFRRAGHTVRVVVRLDGVIWQSDNLRDFSPVAAGGLDAGLPRLAERAVRRVQSALRLPYFDFFESLRFALACRRALDGFDLLYERIGWPHYGGALASRLMGVPLVLEDNGDPLHDLESKGMAPTGIQRKISLALMRWGIRRAAHIVSTGEGWRRQFINRWRVPPEMVTAVENGTTLVQIQRRENLRSFQPEKTDEPVTLVYVGGFYPWHGIPVLLPAFARALKTGIRARLLLIGAGDGFAEAEQLAAELGIAPAVTFAGHLSPAEFAPLLAQADIGVSPYCGWKEFSGLKILDYKASGLPTIASGENGQPPTVAHGKTGFIVPPCNEDALRDAIVQLSTDARLRRQMGQAARLEAETMHGWNHTAAALEEIFVGVTG